ncbi:DNA topology modulation protein [Paenibacillus sp. UNC451MF]|uniref:DNA topology modulation protein n=1 Tax=Paenibacillus sp. UNC451MF TaxID=1449063 RepID=UPI00048C5AFC|nr:DNA topology modulation protein [Paenibacillus sp. UNC451MF]
MNKVVVIGSGGAGKSTFSRQMGERTGLPVYHLDALNWRPGWEPTPKDEWDALMKQLVGKETWIIDGNYGRTMEIRLQAADTIIFLDMPRHLCVYRLFKRRIMFHGKTRPDLGEGCPEHLDLKFVKWVWCYKRDSRPALLQKLSTLTGQKTIFILRSPREVRQFLEQLPAAKSTV